MKKLLSIIIVFVLMFSLTGCGSNELIGTWKDDTLGMEVTFTEDTVSMMGFSLEYKVSGNKITMSFMGEENVGYFKIVDDKLYMYEEGEDYKDAPALIRVEK